MNNNPKYNQIWLTRVYALLRVASPETLLSQPEMFDRRTQVAARLMDSSNVIDQFSVIITDDSDKQHGFSIDLTSQHYQSKGNWLWVTKIEFFFQNEQILALDINKQVIDIPYTGKSINAYWLLKEFTEKLALNMAAIRDAYF